MPRPSRNLLQLIAVSSVTFHMVDHATSMTSSKTERVNRSFMSVSIVCEQIIPLIYNLHGYRWFI